MIGKPKYEFGDMVVFEIDNQEKIGSICIVDEYGTFFDDSDASYDIMVKEENVFYKHIKEPSIKKKIDHIIDPW